MIFMVWWAWLIPVQKNASVFFFFSLYSGLWPLQRALLQICVEREAPGASQEHSASWLAYVYNPWILWPVQYPLSISCL